MDMHIIIICNALVLFIHFCLSPNELSQSELNSLHCTALMDRQAGGRKGERRKFCTAVQFRYIHFTACASLKEQTFASASGNDDDDDDEDGGG